jgi:hypothetical protein
LDGRKEKCTYLDPLDSDNGTCFLVLLEELLPNLTKGREFEPAGFEGTGTTDAMTLALRLKRLLNRLDSK